MTLRPELYGPVPVEEWTKALAAPAGGAAEIIRKYDPLFGMEIGADGTRKFLVKVSKTVKRRDRAAVEVEALDEEHAEKVIDKMDWDGFVWDEGYGEDEDDHEIDSIKEIA